ncbi:AAA ATPase domain-containing protein [Micromonospora sediminimaris]|uniref:Guanylate cyclase domain-containing protein n=1 Tax=Micromonospora sediminimaris TaxID=547162 RepID=A0A9W5XI58_9ACTN|nr:hypothetical protein Vse01_06220 [Micromonospora sediminimaris]SFC39324.1 AAA ATPase domain-containing protein [Micromonospora sediminimaris]
MPSSVVAGQLAVERVPWPVTEERRTITVLFVDIVGSTRLVDRLDPEDVRALQRAYFGTVARVLRRWNGAVEKYVGDAVMALFGARRADGWDAYRAVRAGLEIQRALDGRPLASAPGLRVRVGVATGEAVVDLAVDHDGGHGVASGAVITLAARLQEHAPPGGVALCPATHRAVVGLIAQRPVPAVTVTGKALPVDVWHAIGTERPRPPRHDIPLFGRRRELAVAREQLAEAVRGRGDRRVLLLGPPGSGRSRLLRELVRSTRTLGGVPVRWCSTTCPPYPEGPLDPVADLVRGLAQAGTGDDPETVRRRLAAALTDLVPAELLTPALNTVEDLLGVTVAQTGMVAYWREVLLSLARRQPVVVAVDDLDRAAPALRHQLAVLVELADKRDLPLVLVATGTQELELDASGPGVVRVLLSPLDTITTGRLLRRLLRRAGRPAWMAARLIPVTGGSPGRAVAYVRTVTGGDSGSLPVPEGVRRVVEARLDRLDADARAVLTAAALAPGRTGAELAEVLDWPRTRAAAELATLTRDGLLVHRPAGGYDVADPVLRQVTDARLPRAVRAVLARRIDQVTSAAATIASRMVERTCAAAPRSTARSAVLKEGQHPIPGQLGSDRVVVDHGRVGEEMPRPGIAVHHEIRSGRDHLPLPLVDLVGRVVGVRVGQVQVHPEAGTDRRRGSSGAVQQQQAGGVGSFGQQRAGHPGTHREPGEHGVGRQPVERRAGPVQNCLLADPLQQGEARRHGVDGGHAVQVGRVHLMAGGAQPVGGRQHRRPQPVHGVEEHDVSHRDIVPDARDHHGAARTGSVPGGAWIRVGWSSGAGSGVSVPGRPSVPGPAPPDPIRQRQGELPRAGSGSGHGTPRPPPHPPGSR